MRVRRAVASAAIVGALVLSPSAAFGYGAEDYTDTGTASTTTPAVGQSFTITVVGPPGARVTLTITSSANIPDSAIQIAGTKSLTRTADASGTAVFTVTLSQAGTFTAVVTDAESGEVLSTQTFQVAGSVAEAPGGELSSTGSDVLPLALGAGAVLVLGAGAVVYATKRRERTQV
ncbi:peptidase [Cellulomonas palmilytica]|uniref:peptidase n=1 Tax=Cellulomonas palmilytica TaxID=2608402 RepID=UPI001F48808B|nr:peptidase [Cellulomonas palmilytica]UJP41002.1 peptidase [Cellulomonas palmilytica]